MLYDPKWDGKRKTKDWKSLDNLIGWLETKNPTQTYDYGSPTGCMLAQYLQEQGKNDVLVGQSMVHFTSEPVSFWHKLPIIKYFFISPEEASHLPPLLDEIARYIPAGRHRNFGGALAYARSAKERNIYEPAL